MQDDHFLATCDVAKVLECTPDNVRALERRENSRNKSQGDPMNASPSIDLLTTRHFKNGG